MSEHAPDATMRLFAERRARLFDALPDHTVAVFPSAPVARRNHDVHHAYRQDSDLQYLTGFVEPEAVAILTKSGEDRRFELVVRARDKERETWDGRRAGVDGARNRFGADASRPVAELEAALVDAMGGKRVLVYALGVYEQMDATMLKLLHRFRMQKRKLPPGPLEVHDPAPLLHEMRLVKTRDDLTLMQRAADISVEAHNNAMRACRPGLSEGQVQAVVEGTFRLLGSERYGYPSIVAGGVNATILHYTENDQPLAAGDLLLIDAGAEYGYHTADITRTFPVSGTFSAPQREVYEVVLDAQVAAIEASVVGNTFEQVHDVAVRRLTEGMVGIGLLEGDVDRLIADEAYKRYYMHRTGHWLGMDVHDVGEYREGHGEDSRVLGPGMVMTVEPGIYVAEDDLEAPEPYRGIGVRIEDDVLVTSEGPKILTAGCPKTVADVEALMQEPMRWPEVG